MNCKQGDLAFIVRSTAGNEGKIVRCLELIEEKRWCLPSGDEIKLPSWRIDRELVGHGGDRCMHVPDAWLRPIRPGDMDDETVTDKELEAA